MTGPQPPKDAARAAPAREAMSNQALNLVFDAAVRAHQGGDLARAEQGYRQVLRSIPDFAQALQLLGVLRAQSGSLDEAEGLLRQALARGAGWDALGNLGRVLAEQGKQDEAELAYRQALKLNPGYADALNNLGIIRQSQSRFAEAEQMYRRALELDAAGVSALGNLASLLLDRGRLDEAESQYRRLLALCPKDAEAWNRLGLVLFMSRRHAEAAQAYRNALSIQPRHGDSALKLAYANRAHCAWATLETDDARVRQLVASGLGAGIRPFPRLAEPGVDALALRETARQYGGDWLKSAFAQPPLVPSGHDYGHAHCRIGYLSADFHDHATLHLLIGVLEAHDRSDFSIALYSHGQESEDAWRLRAQAAVDSFVDISTFSDHEASRRIAADEVDILVDLKGYTQNGRLAISAYRPAPIIVSWLGYPGTLGETRLADYLIGDPVVTPVDHAAYYSETLALMPHCYQPNDRNRAIGPTPSRAEAGLPETGLVFCSFNQAYKLGPEMFDTWCALLREVPGSVLWLLDPGPEARANLAREAEARGVPAERLVYADKLPLAAHLARLGLADLALDTYPYTSHTTGSDALWAGVPMLTRMGETFASRVGASLLRAVGLDELVTTTQADYQRLALALAADPPRLAGLRARLAENRRSAPLFDTERFTRDLERLYRRILAECVQGTRRPIVLDDPAHAAPGE